MAELIAARTGHFTAADLAADARAGTWAGPGDDLPDPGAAAPGRASSSVWISPTARTPTWLRAQPSPPRRVLPLRKRRGLRRRELASVVRAVASRTGFRIDTHRLELFGLCPACQLAGRHER